MTDVFDGVMVCTGHHVTPLVPTFKDQHKFKGTILHSHSYKKPDGFEDKTVVVVGIGNSGGDAVVELSTVANKVFHSLLPIISFTTTVTTITTFAIFSTFTTIIRTFVVKIFQIIF